MDGFQRFHFHSVGEDVPEATRPALRGIRGGLAAGTGEPEAGFNSDESAARFHLSQLLEDDDRPAVRGVVAPQLAQRVPNLRLTASEDLPQTQTTLVSFEQTRDEIPVFGAHAVCELDADRGLVSASGKLADVTGVSSIASISDEQARAAIAALAGTDPGALSDTPPGKLNFFRDGDGDGLWHLVYLFEKVPVAPPALVEEAKGHGLGRSPRSLHPLVTYLVDAHDGKVVLHFASTPLLAALPVPVKGSGCGEDGNTVDLWGQANGTGFELRDPLRYVTTYDLNLADIDGARLSGPFTAPSPNLGTSRPDIVSAHHNATVVFDFINGVLLRDGIDGKRMALENVVNCTYAADEAPPVWHNAVWYGNRMWYGQAPDASGSLVSFSKHLDVIAHELSHGITEYTANLIYLNQSGALNESFSDIFGIIIKNWDVTDPATGGDVATWDWVIGAGIGHNGGPLRDMSDPTVTGDPAHMDDYLHTTGDSGGVHTNSNIHNKAAYNVLTATDGAGQRIFIPREVAYLYYLGLTRLGRTDEFNDALQAVVDVAMTYYSGNQPDRDAKVAGIRKAYADVGIT
ncbi:MAG: bacillolysin [Baekduia sp.]|nr:bacillolysin [Baekduia sp.]